MFPPGKVLPEVWVDELDATWQLSFGVGVIQLAGAAQVPGKVFTETTVEQFANVGPSTSKTVTWKLQVLLLPLASLTLQVTPVNPT